MVTSLRGVLSKTRAASLRSYSKGSYKSLLTVEADIFAGRPPVSFCAFGEQRRHAWPAMPSDPVYLTLCAMQKVHHALCPHCVRHNRTPADAPVSEVGGSDAAPLFAGGISQSKMLPTGDPFDRRGVDPFSVPLSDEEDAANMEPPRALKRKSRTSSRTAPARTSPTPMQMTTVQLHHLLLAKGLVAVQTKSVLRRVQRRLSVALQAPTLTSSGRVKLVLDGFEEAVLRALWFQA